MKISFDQAAPYYDRTRADPPWVMDAMADAFIQSTHVTGKSKILEVGVGTGRIAVPLVARGLSIVGVDLSLAMMRELQRKNRSQVSLVQSDATTLPFPDAAFDAVYAVHVYHLIGNWRVALAEARRVVKPGGTLILSYHFRAPDSTNRKLRKKFGELAQARGFSTERPGAKDDEFRAELATWDGVVETVEVAQWVYRVSPSLILDEIAQRIYSDTWLVPADVNAELMPELRGWALEEFGDLSREVETAGEFNWLVVRKLRAT